jgi:hypothetical protein
LWSSSSRNPAQIGGPAPGTAEPVVVPFLATLESMVAAGAATAEPVALPFLATLESMFVPEQRRPNPSPATASAATASTAQHSGERRRPGGDASGPFVQKITVG